MSDKTYTEEQVKDIVVNLTADILKDINRRSSDLEISAKNSALRFIIEGKEGEDFDCKKYYSTHSELSRLSRDISDRRYFLSIDSFLTKK